MHGSQGGALVGEIRADPATPSVPLIGVAACCKGKRGDPLACGFNSGMGKPPRRSAFLEAVRTALEIPASPAGLAARATGSPDQREAREDAGRICILLVEDRRVNQKVVVRMLKAAGYTCDVANNGREGVDAFTSSEYDFIIMHCQMPVMDGFQATAEIRKRESGGKHTPIVALTADVVKGNRERCLEAGMDDYLTKPVLPETLLAMLEKHIGTPGTSSAGSADQHAQSGGEPLDIRCVQRLADGERKLERELISVFEGEGEDYLRRSGQVLASSGKTWYERGSRS